MAEALPKLGPYMGREGREHEYQGLSHLPGAGTKLGYVLRHGVVQLDQPRHCDVEPEFGVEATDGVDCLMELNIKGIESVELLGAHPARPGFLVHKVAPQPLQEPPDTNDVIGTPRPIDVEVAHGHLVQAKGVGAVVRIDR